MTQVLAVGISVAVFEAFLVWSYLMSGIPPAAAMFLHWALVIGLFAWTYRSRRFVSDRTWPLLLSLTTSVMGPIGALGTLSTMGLTVWYRRSVRPFDEWYAAIFPEARSYCAPLPETRPFSTAASGVSAFTDVLAFGTIAEKQELLVLITRQFRPEFAPALKLALRDSSNAIRVQAASAVTKLEDDYTRKSLQLSESLGSAPGPAELLAVAIHYQEYAATGLLDAVREEAAHRSALEAYAQYLAVEPGNIDACTAYGRLLLRVKDLRTARTWLENCVSAGKRSPEILLLYMEVLFELKEFARLREVARQHHSRLAENAPFLDESCEAVRLWAGAAV
jgi:hypothetical protein